MRQITSRKLWPQEREWAVGEIRRLRRDVDRLSRKHEATRIEREISQNVVDAKSLDPALNAQRMIRLAEVATMIGELDARSRGVTITRLSDSVRCDFALFALISHAKFV
jgi:hypothetical protein